MRASNSTSHRVKVYNLSFNHSVPILRPYRHRTRASEAMATHNDVPMATSYLTPLRTMEDLKTEERARDAVVLLNYDLPPHALSLWMSCSYRVCADGGANRVQDLRVAYDDATKEFNYSGEDVFKHPHRIVGDMDSVWGSVASMYRDNEAYGCLLDDQSDDQDSTDFAKCLRAITKHKPEVKRVFTLGALGGRLDHVLYNMKTLFDFPELEIVLIGDDSMARAVPAGKTTIKRDARHKLMHCGLVPLQGNARVSTTGLKWNLNDEVMSFNAGGLISTSNQFVEDEVMIWTDVPLLFTASPLMPL